VNATAKGPLKIFRKNTNEKYPKKPIFRKNTLEKYLKKPIIR
jgi:hypothetical protein